MEALREVLSPWLGDPRYKQTEGRVTFTYRFASEDTPTLPLRLKVEINTREHFAVEGFTKLPFSVSSRWFKGSCEIYKLRTQHGNANRTASGLITLAIALMRPKGSIAGRRRGDRFSAALI
jgi:hypothetical protein